MPPVTKEWFEARKAQLAGASTSSDAGRVWIDPLTKKKFSTENTYLAHTRSKKYQVRQLGEKDTHPCHAHQLILHAADHQDMVKKSGSPMPAPIVVTKTDEASRSDAGGKQFS